MIDITLIFVLIIMLIGIIGTIVPLIPGTVITGTAAFLYAWWGNFQTIPLNIAFGIFFLTLITGTADLWMPLLGARAGGASPQTILYGLVGTVIGFIVGSIIPLIGNLIGGVAGYVGGILYAEYLKYEDWNRALKAGLGGLAGWGLATAVQLGGAILITIIFLTQVF